MIIDERPGLIVRGHYLFDAMPKRGGPGEDPELLVYVNESGAIKEVLTDPALLIVAEVLQEKLEDMALH